MAFFPKVDSPCPVKDRLSELMVGDVCSMCEREVYDLTDMTDDARREFMKSCTGEVCVSYSVPIKRAIATAAITSAGVLMAGGAAAQSDLYCYGEIIVGGVKDASTAEFVDMSLDAHIPELPVIYDETPMPEGGPDLVKMAETKLPVNAHDTTPVQSEKVLEDTPEPIGKTTPLFKETAFNP